jgi:hypothetical protein
LAHRLFVLLLPSALLPVAVLGLHAGAVGESTGKVGEEVGLHGLIGPHVAETASSPARWIFFLVTIPVVLYALVKLYRAVAIVHALAWRRSGRGVGFTAAGIGLLGAALVVDVGAAAIVGWVRRHNEAGGLAALLVYFTLVGGAWLLVSRRLPGGEAGWRPLVTGAARGRCGPPARQHLQRLRHDAAGRESGDHLVSLVSPPRSCSRSSSSAGSSWSAPS